MLLLVLIPAALLCASVWVMMEKRRLNRLTSRTATLAGELPIIGHALMFASKRNDPLDVLHTVRDEASKNGGAIKLWLGPKVVIGITDLGLFKKLANTCLDKSMFYTFGESLFGNGLIISNGSLWKHHRKIINPMFNQHVLNGFLKVFNDTSLGLVKSLRERDGPEEFDPWPYISNNSLDTAYQTIIGLSPEEQIVDGKTYASALLSVTEGFVERGKNMLLYPNLFYNHSNCKRRADENVATLKKVTNHAMRLKRSREKHCLAKPHIKNNPGFVSVLDMLLEAEDKGLFTENDVADELNNLMLAGYDTTATTLLYTLLTIGSYPRVQEKLQREVTCTPRNVVNRLTEVFSGSLRDATKEDLPRLEYLEAVIKETLRLYPIVPVVARSVAKTEQLGEHTFPAGSELLLFIDAMHTLDGWGGDVRAFRPERFLHKDSGVDLADMFLPFSYGRRNCIGKTYAMMSMKVTLSHVLRNYELKGNIDDLRVAFDVVVKPISGFNMQVKSK